MSRSAQSVTQGAGRSRPGRRSDDGHIVLRRIQVRLERDAEQVFLYRQANSNPRPSPLPDDRFSTATRRALTSHRSGPHRTRRYRGALMLET